MFTLPICPICHWLLDSRVDPLGRHPAPVPIFRHTEVLMFAGLAKRILGSANDRYVKKLEKTVEQINALEPDVQALSADEMPGRNPWVRGRPEAEGRLAEQRPEMGRGA